MSHVQHTDSVGNKIPSVSEIPGIYSHDIAGFEDWICSKLHGFKGSHCCIKAKRDFYKEAANLGHDIHALREAFLKGETFSDGVPEYQAKVFEPIAKFYKDSGYKPIFIEEQMTGKTFGGTLDGAGTFANPFWELQRKSFWSNLDEAEGLLPTSDSVWIEDLKIKSKLDALHPLQLYGYRELLIETKGVTADWGLIIRREKKLDKMPQIQLKAYYLPAYESQWNASVLMWKFLNG